MDRVQEEHEELQGELPVLSDREAAAGSDATEVRGTVAVGEVLVAEATVRIGDELTVGHSVPVGGVCLGGRVGQVALRLLRFAEEDDGHDAVEDVLLVARFGRVEDDERERLVGAQLARLNPERDQLLAPEGDGLQLLQHDAVSDGGAPRVVLQVDLRAGSVGHAVPPRVVGTRVQGFQDK